MNRSSARGVAPPGAASAPRVLVAGGGTGGHVFPGIAVADALRAIADVEPVFVGTTRGLEQRVIPARGYQLELLQAEPIKGGGPRRAVRGAAVAVRETARAVSLLRRVSPRAVLSVGGYAAGSVALAASLMGIPLAVLEPNAAVGLANRLLAPVAGRAYVAWREVALRFRSGRARLYGVPLRAGFEPAPYGPVAPGNPLRILVMGGSQGAQALDERAPAALARAAADADRTLEIIHQAGGGRLDAVREAYARTPLRGVRVVPFVDDVAAELARAHLVVARAGAVTVAEIAAVGRPALLVPFPFAADDHQAKNALALERAGGAVCLRQEAAEVSTLARTVAALARDPERRARMALAAQGHGRPRAAYDVAHDLLAFAGLAARVEPAEPRSTGGASGSSRGGQPGGGFAARVAWAGEGL